MFKIYFFLYDIGQPGTPGLPGSPSNTKPSYPVAPGNNQHENNFCLKTIRYLINLSNNIL